MNKMVINAFICDELINNTLLEIKFKYILINGFINSKQEILKNSLNSLIYYTLALYKNKV